jgi:3-polyprenyl-4-hydroxybenzoate decarboxylase
MAYKSMREFMAHLEREARLVRVGAPVSTVLEMTGQWIARVYARADQSLWHG